MTDGSKTTMMDLFRTPNMRMKTLIICFSWYHTFSSRHVILYVKVPFDWIERTPGSSTKPFTSAWATMDRLWAPTPTWAFFCHRRSRFPVTFHAYYWWIVGVVVCHYQSSWFSVAWPPFQPLYCRQVWRRSSEQMTFLFHYYWLFFFREQRPERSLYFSTCWLKWVSQEVRW